ncbi:hypothetical protein [Lysinibacillus sp. FJAT-14222]|uniref:hypothetical protein n=1 Tax=Lysinibacillus sp. FJAT-14222 TaxID=1932366 RepID=UPI0009E93FB1|nr:hypothetical protein [Lysinibacillus sp. FJAT-14222]
MDRVLTVSSYGICLFSLDVLEDFLKKEKVRSKKLLKNFQDNHNRYLTLLTEGIWIPFLPIDSIKYVIKLDNYNQSFDDEWEEKLVYHDFNIEVQDTLWIASMGLFYEFDKNKFIGNDEVSYQTLDGITLNSGFGYNVSSGKYSVSIKGYARKNKLDYPNANFGFLFSLVKVNEFEGFNDPREDERYNFNVADMD